MKMKEIGLSKKIIKVFLIAAIALILPANICLGQLTGMVGAATQEQSLEAKKTELEKKKQELESEIAKYEKYIAEQKKKNITQELIDPYINELEKLNISLGDINKEIQAITSSSSASSSSSSSTQNRATYCALLQKENPTLYKKYCSGVGSSSSSSTSGISPGSTTGSGLTGDDITFTNFTGTFDTPDESGYDPSLTQNKTLREYVLNVLQFALGFLGLAAVLVVIYGGVLYVASGGNEETAGKGKKAIAYAVIGIVIILGSFALVNTLFQAGTGTDRNIPSGGGPATGGASMPVSSGSDASDIKLTYQRSAQSLGEINQLLDYKYQQYLTINESIRQIGNVSIRTSSPEYKQATVDEYSRAIDNLRQRTESLSALQEEVDKEITSGNIKVDGKMFADPSYAQNVAAILQRAHDKDFNNYVDNEILNNRLKDIFTSLGYDWNSATAIVGIGNVQGGEITKTIENKLRGVKQNIESLKTQKNNETVLKIISGITEVTKLINSTEFVKAEITASTYTGSAPLFVNFDALNSIDPSGQTIPDSNYQWDLIGVEVQSVPSAGGQPACKVISSSNSTANCKNAQGPNVSAVYNKVGRYRVSLNVKSGEPEKYATGTAFIDIVVEPPSSEIKLSATPKSTGASYKLDGLSVYQVTEIEGEKGIDFDATGSKGKGDNPIVEYRWDFGDNTPAEVQKVVDEKDNVAGNASHNYDPGNYQLVLEVTDVAGVKDRKIINVIVASPTARINFDYNRGNVGSEFWVDGTDSITDNGQIVSYEWGVKKLRGLCDTEDMTIDLGENKNAERFRFKPEEPGEYAFTLRVTDSVGRSNSTPVSESAKLYVESRIPRADLKISNPNKYKPNNYVFDATDSTDSDKKDTLYYRFYVDDKLVSTPVTATINPAAGIIPAQTKDSCAYANYGSNESKMEYLFTEKGDYNVRVNVTDEHGQVDSYERRLKVNNILDIDFQPVDGDYAKNLSDNGRAKFTFDAKHESNAAIRYEWDFGDYFNDDEEELNFGLRGEHTYTKAGIYTVTLKIFDEEDYSNTIRKKIYVGSGKGPVAILSVKRNGQEIPEGEEEITVSRNDVLSFDATGSKTAEGTQGLGNLRFSWNMGRSEDDLIKGPVIEGFKYVDISEKDKPFNVELFVSPLSLTTETPDESDKDLATRTLKINVVKLPPKFSGIEVTPMGSKNETPLQVKLRALGATDPDGKITNYKWWYYDKDNSSKILDTQISLTPETTMVINTNGEEGETHTYKFGLEITDSDNLKISTNEIILDPSPMIENIVNGPNKPPKADFTVNKTNILVGETLNFVSTSKDEDGEIKQYIWDFEGNGFYDNKPTDKTNITHTFTEKNTAGIEVRVKAIDNNNATGVSDPIRIYVDTISTPPEAAFTYELTGDKKVTFTNSSKTDERTGQKISKIDWDFNVIEDADGNGVTDDDSETANIDNGKTKPNVYIHEYPDYGIYRVKLTVTDTEGNQDNVTRFVKVEKEETTTIPVATGPEARLITNPAPQVTDGKIHLSGNTGAITFDYKTSKGQIAKYTIDKNIFYDTDGNGINNDDQDHSATAQDIISGKRGTWTTNFDKSWGRTAVRLTVIDINGQKDFVDKEIIFDNATSNTASYQIKKTGTVSVFQANAFINIAKNIQGNAGLAMVGGFAILLVGSALIYKRKK